MDILVISLPEREDRQAVVTKSLSIVGLEFEFLFAEDLADFNHIYHQSRATALYPIWLSHVIAMKQLLNSDQQWISVFEDDADFSKARQISREYITHLAQVLPSMTNRIDMFQLGFNEDGIPGIKGMFIRIFLRVFRVLPNDFSLCRRLVSSLGMSGMLQSSRQLSPRFSFSFLVQGHSRRGTHAYIVNRRFAEFLIDYFEKNLTQDKLLPLDSFLYHLTNTPNPEYKVVRFSQSLINQNDSPSNNLIHNK